VTSVPVTKAKKRPSEISFTMMLHLPFTFSHRLVSMPTSKHKKGYQQSAPHRCPQKHLEAFFQKGDQIEIAQFTIVKTHVNK
jgi:hypothetical protein